VRVYACAFGLPATYFDGPFTDVQYKLRATHYPSQPEAPDDEFGIAPHTDTSFLTLLAPNDVPGLAFRTQAGEWIDVPTVPNGFIVNGGQLLLRWTNDCFLATPHRAVTAPAASATRWRFSAMPRLIGRSPPYRPVSAPADCPNTRRPITPYTDYMIRYQARTYNVFGDQPKGAAA
jgi:isopenicillin N synthase-like dioxygenase